VDDAGERRPDACQRMTYRAGVIGAGGVAGMGLLGTHEVGAEGVRASHAGGYREADGIELVAVADVDPDTLDQFGEAWEIPPGRRYLGHREMLGAESLDVVSIATPTYLHHDHVLDAIDLADPGVIWCEKPIASSLTEAEAMTDACREAGVELVVNHTLRFTEKIQRLRDLLQRDSLLGTVGALHARFRMELMRNSTHLLDTVIYLLDARASRIAGYVTGENEAVDALGAAVEVDDAGGGGFVVTTDGTFVTVDCTSPREHSSMQFDFVGSAGKLTLNNDDGEWRYWRLEDGTHIEDELPGIEGAWSWGEDYEAGFPNAARHLVDLLDGEAENASTGEEATRSLEIIVGFYVSHATGSSVSIPLDRPLRDVRIRSW
jgi:predicted dehydrogenase